jgi:hypothetical protein
MSDFIKSHVFDPKNAKLGDFHLKRMFLYPKFWGEFTLPKGVNLNWHTIKFGEDSNDDNFRNNCGIYSFVVQPEIANHPHASYLLYIGKTTRPIRDRYLEYKRDLKKEAEETQRPHVTVMLQKWNAHLMFSYAPLMAVKPTQKEKELINKTEMALIKAYLPAVNKNFPGEIAEIGQAINNIILGN